MAKTCVLVANSSRAVVFIVDSPARAPRIIFRVDDPQAKPADSEAFARRIADLLESAHQIRGFDRLVLIAEPEFLSVIHGALGVNFAKLVALSIPRDIADESEPLLSARLQYLIADQLKKVA